MAQFLKISLVIFLTIHDAFGKFFMWILEIFHTSNKFFEWIGQNYCYSCDSSNGSYNCINDLNDLNVCTNDPENSLGCFHSYDSSKFLAFFIDKMELTAIFSYFAFLFLIINIYLNIVTGGAIKRGCADYLTEDQLNDCKEGLNCKLCYADQCNGKKEFQYCYSCNSDNEPNCAILSVKLDSMVCDDYMDTCKTLVKPNTTTVRGCSSQIKQECPSLSFNCKVCNENLCNGEIFPSNRLTCFHEMTHCRNDDTIECFKTGNEDLNMAHACERYNFRDSCFMYLNENDTVFRGCLSDTKLSEYCIKNSKKCKICQSSNCNNESVIRTPKLSCIKCDSTKHVNDCLWGFNENVAEQCNSNIYFYEEESCFTLVVSNKSIIRGCTADTNICKINNNCSICSQKNGCNNKNILTQSCYKLIDDSLHVSKRTCKGLITASDQGCFLWKNNSVILRGCISELSFENKGLCANDSDCKICLGQNCNSLVNGYGKTLSNSCLMIFAIVFSFLNSFVII